MWCGWGFEIVERSGVPGEGRMAQVSGLGKLKTVFLPDSYMMMPVRGWALGFDLGNSKQS